MVERFECDNGIIIYRNKNKLNHRDDGPAVIYPDGTEFWYKNGEFHRDDGPAIILSNGNNYWYLNDIKYSFKEWVQELNISDEQKMELVLRYG